MSTPTNPGANAYTQGFGSAPLSALGIIPILSTRSPSTSDIQGLSGPLKIGQQWINTVTEQSFILVNISSAQGVVTAIWNENSSPGAGAINTLTGNTGGAIDPIGGNINVVGAGTITTSGVTGTLTIHASAGGFPITPFVVGPSGEAGYQTIQSAMNAANAAGGGVLYVQPGTFTENLTWYTGVTMVGTQPSSFTTEVNIIGQHTIVAGTSPFRIFGAEGLTFQSTGNLFSSSISGELSGALIECTCSANGLSAYVFHFTALSPSTNSTFEVTDTLVISGSTMSVNTGIALNASNSVLGFNGSTGSTNPGGSWSFVDTNVGEPLTCTSGSLTGTNSIFNATITHSGNTSAAYLRCTWFSDPNACLVFNGTSAGQMTNCSFFTSATNAIDGTSAGTQVFVDCSFGVSDTVNPSLTSTITSTLFTGRFVAGTMTDDPRAFSTINVNQANAAQIWGLQLTGTSDGGSLGNSIFNIFDNTIQVPTVSGGTLCGINTNVRFFPPFGVTVALAAGIFSAPFVSAMDGTVTNAAGFYANAFIGPLPITGVITNAYGGYFNDPGVGTNAAALYADNANIGFAGQTPPTSGLCISGQLTVGAPSGNSSALVYLQSVTQGFEPPAMTTVQKLAIGTPLEGLVVYDLTLHQLSYYNGTVWVNL